MTSIKQGHQLEIGFKVYSMGRILSLTPEQIQLEVLLQDTQSLRGLPFSLKRIDTFENGVVKEVQVFDGWVKNAVAMSEQSVTTYSIITAESQVYTALQQTLLHTVKAEASQEELLLTEVQTRTGSSFLVPDAQSLMAELLTKRTSEFYPSYIASYLIDSVMHKDAVDLYKSLKQCIREFDANKAGVPSSLKDKEQVMNIVLSGVTKINDMTAIEKPYLWRSPGTNFITLQSSAFYYSGDTTIDQVTVAANLFNKNLITANLLYFQFVKGTAGPFPEVLLIDTFTKAWVSFIAAVSSVTVGNGTTYVDMESEINFRISEMLNFNDIPVWYDYKDKKVWFEDAGYNNHTYLKTTLEKFISENKAFFKPFSKGGGVDIDKYRSMIMKSSFVRAGTNAGTLRYWNGRVSEKIVDTSRLHVSHKNPFEVLNTITKRAGMDIMRRQMQYASEGSLMNVLTTFYSSYFMRINACFPVKGYTAEGTVMTGSFMVSMNNSMGIAPSYFIPLELWQTSGFTAAARPDREEYYFFVRDKVLRDLIEKDSPPYLFNYKDGWGQLIEIGNMDDFFAKDYLRSLYRSPVIAELTVDRTLLSALTDQKGETEGKAFETQSVKNEIVDPVVIMKSYFERMFNRYYESITGTSDTDKVFQASPIDLTSFKLFFDIYVKYLKLAEAVTAPLSTHVLAGALLNSFSLYDTLAGSAWGTNEFGWTEEEFKQVGTFYPTLEQYNSTVWGTLSKNERSLTDSISAYLLSVDYGDDVDTGNPLNYDYSNFYKDFCRDKTFTHKSDPGFVRFMDYLHAAEGGDAINTMDGTKALQMPSRYGLQIDKLLPFVKYHCANNAIDGDEFRGYIRQYNVDVKDFYSKNGKKPSRTKAEEIIRKITVSNSYTARLFSSFMTFSKDEASEITYWVMFRGGTGMEGSLLKGETNRPGFKILSFFLDTYFQHGGSADRRFVDWYNNKSPTHTSHNAYTFKWEGMAALDRTMWGSILGKETLDSTVKLRDICRIMAASDKVDVDRCMESLIKYRQYVFLDVESPAKGFETRLNRLVGFTKGLPMSDTAVKTGTVKVPKEYGPVLPTVVSMLTESLNRLQDIIEGAQPVTSSGLPSNITGFKSMLQSFLTSEPGVELAATTPKSAPAGQPLLRVTEQTLDGSSEDKVAVKINVSVAASTEVVTPAKKLELYENNIETTMSKASAVLAYSCGSYLIQKAVYSDNPYVFSSIADIYDHYLSRDDYNNAVLEAKSGIHTMIVKRYKNPNINVSTLSAKERHTLGSLKNLYFMDSIIKNVADKMETSFIKYKSQDMKDQVMQGVNQSSILCANMIKLAERLIMSDDFLVRLGSDVETALLRSPVQPVQEGSSMLSNLSLSVDTSGSIVKDLKAYSIIAANKSFDGSDILDLKYITPESRAQLILNKTLDMSSMSAPVASILELVSIHLFYKVKWSVSLDSIMKKLFEEPVQRFEKDFSTPVEAIKIFEDNLKSQNYKVKVFAVKELFSEVFKVNNKDYLKKYGPANLRKDPIDSKWNVEGLGIGTAKQRFDMLNTTITGTGSISSYAVKQDVIDAVQVWKILTAAQEPPFLIFYYRPVNAQGELYCGIILDLSIGKDYIKAVRNKSKSDAPVLVVLNTGL